MLRHWLDKFDSRDTKKRLKRKGAMLVVEGVLGRVDKRDSQDVLNVIQAGICDGDQLGTRPDV
ncbi:MAG: hypothetical protein FD162_3544, partial [Rhodobacteraceae bacterium]